MHRYLIYYLKTTTFNRKLSAFSIPNTNLREKQTHVKAYITNKIKISNSGPWEITYGILIDQFPHFLLCFFILWNTFKMKFMISILHVY